MNMPERGPAHRSDVASPLRSTDPLTSLSAHALRVVAVAAGTHDAKTLRELGIDHDVVEVLSTLTPAEIDSALTDVVEPLVDLRIDLDALRDRLQFVDVHRRRQRWLCRLMALGATHSILTALGLHLTHSCYRSSPHRLPHPPGRRHRNLSHAEVLALHRYWESIRNPERIHPIDHFICTCEHFELRAERLWDYLSHHHSLARPAGADESPFKHPWKRVMFPGWRDGHRSDMPRHDNRD